MPKLKLNQDELEQDDQASTEIIFAESDEDYDDDDDDDEDDDDDDDDDQVYSDAIGVKELPKNPQQHQKMMLLQVKQQQQQQQVQPKIPIMKDGTATCIRCGSVGVKDTFYGKGKQYCSASCVRGLPTAVAASKATPLFKIPGGSGNNNPHPMKQTILPIISNTLTPANEAALRRVTAAISSGSVKISSSTPYSSSTTKVTASNTSNIIKGLKATKVNISPITPVAKAIKITTTATSSPKQMSTIGSAKNTQVPKFLLNSYDWNSMLTSDINASSVSSFKNAPLADTWDSLVTVGLKVEVKNSDFSFPTNTKMAAEFYWIASVVKIAGYFVLLRYEGFGSDDAKDFWVNIFTTQVHPVGWCASQGKVLIPPKSIEEKHPDWKAFLVKRLTGSRTLPENFFEQMKDSLKSKFQLNMTLEVVDKKRISAVRVATIDKIIGGRLHITYEGADEFYGGFWCHQHSPLIHPVGWAQVIGHELRATPEYAKLSLEKVLTKKFEDRDAIWTMFPPVPPLPKVADTDLKFKEGMKLEAIDPLNLSTICVATVTKVLRNNYLMIGIDGMMAADGSDWFCYHATSPCIFPVGFCMLNHITLTPPRGYKGEFNWFQYLRETKSIAAPVPLFKKDIPHHGFKEGMIVEAVDLMEPRLICVATIAKVVGRLLRVHFNGWDDSYDQWCDCESPDLFPVGWCHMVGYPLEPPRGEDDTLNSSSSSSSVLQTQDLKKRKGNQIYKGRYKKKRRLTGTSNGNTNGSNYEDDLKSSPNSSDAADFSSKSSMSVSDWVSTPRSPSPQIIKTVKLNVKNPSSDLSNSSVVVKPSPIQPLQPELPKITKLSDDPKQWSFMDVAQFLRVNECGSYCQSFCNNKIDGTKFLRLTREEIMGLTSMKVGPSLKIYALIQSLKDGKKRF